MGPDDFKSMNEVLNRRLHDLVECKEGFSKKPDLILIDGGYGQLHAAKEVIDEMGLDIAVISLAKKYEEICTSVSNEPIILDRNDNILKLLERVRDESHRFAITFHRHLRDKNEFSDPLDSIKGVGKVKRLNLYRQFKTLENIKNASLDELALVRGIDRNLAEKIYEYLNKQQ